MTAGLTTLVIMLVGASAHLIALRVQKQRQDRAIRRFDERRGLLRGRAPFAEDRDGVGGAGQVADRSQAIVKARAAGLGGPG